MFGFMKNAVGAMFRSGAGSSAIAGGIYAGFGGGNILTGAAYGWAGGAIGAAAGGRFGQGNFSWNKGALQNAASVTAAARINKKLTNSFNKGTSNYYSADVSKVGPLKQVNNAITEGFGAQMQGGYLNLGHFSATGSARFASAKMNTLGRAAGTLIGASMSTKRNTGIGSNGWAHGTSPGYFNGGGMY